MRAVGPDAVQQLLDAETDRPVELALDGSYGPGSASAWLAQQAAAELGADADADAQGRTVLVFPLPGRRRVLGVLVVRAHDGHGLRDLEPSVRTVLDLTARRVGLVIDNARLYDREHRLAETLQRAMLPEQAEVDGLDVWTYYAPNSENAQVGGDWYDVLQVSPDVVGVVIGDVVGHDVEAAASMGQLRSVVRSYIFDITTPGPVLERVDQLVAGMRVPRPASLVLSTLTRSERAVAAGVLAGRSPAGAPGPRGRGHAARRRGRAADRLRWAAPEHGHGRARRRRRRRLLHGRAHRAARPRPARRARGPVGGGRGRHRTGRCGRR